jgi:hypothetical protein
VKKVRIESKDDQDERVREREWKLKSMHVMTKANTTYVCTAKTELLTNLRYLDREKSLPSAITPVHSYAMRTTKVSCLPCLCSETGSVSV